MRARLRFLATAGFALGLAGAALAQSGGGSPGGSSSGGGSSSTGAATTSGAAGPVSSPVGGSAAQPGSPTDGGAARTRTGRPTPGESQSPGDPAVDRLAEMERRSQEVGRRAAKSICVGC
jgi:hypothetical protein